MSKPTTTRASIRNEVCRHLGMEFFRRFSTALACDTDSTPDTLVDATLTQPDGWWKNMWLYVTSDSGSPDNEGSVRLIDDFSSAENKLFLEYPLASSPTATTNYEIHNIFSPFEIHDAINEAIRSSYPSFFDVIKDETLIFEEDKLSYNINSLAYDPWIISSVWIEQPSITRVGIADSATVNTLVDSSADLTNVNSGWKISIYYGTGSGQIRNISSASGSTITVSTDWTTNPDTTSKYRIWDVSTEEYDWYRVPAWRTDQDEHPTYLYFPQTYLSAYGCRIRLIYATQPIELTTDAATTVVPKEYVVAKTLEILAANKVASNSMDRNKYAGMEQIYRQRAEIYKAKNGFRMPVDMSLDFDVSSPSAIGEENPLGW